MANNAAVKTTIAADPYPDAPDKPLGPVNAALIAAGVGCFAVGFTTTLAEASKPVKTLMTLSTAVGPLSGKVVFAVVAWLVAWLILHLALRKSALAFGKALTITLILIALGLLGTFPLFFGALH